MSSVSSIGLRFALRYAKAGYAVLPVWHVTQDGECACPKGAKCPHAGKHPMVMRGVKDATTVTKYIEHWWKRWPSAHVGITPPEGCVIIDIDPQHGGDKTWKDLKGDHRLPDTPSQRSGGGGIHYVFRGVIDSGKIGDGIDLRKSGRGYVVTQPSGHASGGQYVWLKDKAPWDLDPAPLPKWLDQSRNPFSKESAVPTGNIYTLKELKKILKHVNSDHRPQWTNVGSALKHEYREDAWSVFLWWSQRSENFNSDEYTRKVWNTLDKNKDTTKLYTMKSVRMLAREGGWDSKDPEEMFEKQKKKKRDSNDYQVFGANELMREELLPPQMFIEGLVAAGVMALSGKPKVGKSWMLLSMAMRFTNGLPFLERKTHKGRCLYLALEDNKRRMQSRINKLTRGGMIMSPRFDYMLNAPRVDDNFKTFLKELITKKKYKLIIIDTVAMIRPSKRGEGGIWQNDYAVMQVLKEIADEESVAIVISMHNRKGTGGEAQDQIATTGGTVAGCDGFCVLERTGKMVEYKNNDLHLFRFTVEHRDFEGSEIGLVFVREDAEWHSLGGFNMVAQGEVQEAIMQALRNAGEEGMGLSNLVNTTGLEKNSLNQALMKMRKHLLVETSVKGVNRIARGDGKSVFG